jgi:hypothetical protein
MLYNHSPDCLQIKAGLDFSVFSLKNTQSASIDTDSDMASSSMHLPSCWWMQFEEQLIIVMTISSMKHCICYKKACTDLLFSKINKKCIINKKTGALKPPAFYLNNRRQPRQTPVSTDTALYIMYKPVQLCHRNKTLYKYR